jgi:2-keto-4-pentenoate hydratase/2-oxohepta-3-ene-1,7-dioic acid hydratase in catechol pathway
MKVARAVRADGTDRAGSRLYEVAGDTATELLATDARDPLLDVLHAGGEMASLARGATVRLADLRVLAPLARPGKIVAIGLNYQDHTAETGLAAPAEPLTFAKYPTSIIGPDDAIVVPATITDQVDWEAELALVIGRRCGPDRRGTPADIGGYTVANDVSARDLQFGDKQWTRGKSLDTFCPLGPYLVTPDEVPDPSALHIWARVNDETMQDASTADMIFDIPTLLDFVTATVTLEPGDVILTGTPPGVGAFRNPPVFLADGDVVTVGVDGVGELRNPVRHV